MYPYRLASCDCLETFRNCLTALGEADSEATEVKRIFFDVLNMKCSRKEPLELCHEYSEWFDECKNSTLTSILKVD